MRAAAVIPTESRSTRPLARALLRAADQHHGRGRRMGTAAVAFSDQGQSAIPGAFAIASFVSAEPHTQADIGVTVYVPRPQPQADIGVYVPPQTRLARCDGRILGREARNASLPQACTCGRASMRALFHAQSLTPGLNCLVQIELRTRVATNQDEF